MIGEIAGYGTTALTAFGAIYFGFKQVTQGQNATLTARVDKLAAKVQMLERRELWHETKELILIRTLEEHDIAVPAMPAPPEAYES